MATYIDKPAFAAAQRHLEAACAASRTHSELAAAALALHGAHGPQISGCVRDHFPAPTKEWLRFLAREVSARCDLARQCRPKGARTRSIDVLWCEVATRDGSGFYGPAGRP